MRLRSDSVAALSALMDGRGEIAPVSHATVVTETPSVIYRLTAGALHRMESDEPRLAIALHHFMARLLTERLGVIQRTLRSLTR